MLTWFTTKAINGYAIEESYHSGRIATYTNYYPRNAKAVCRLPLLTASLMRKD